MLDPTCTVLFSTHLDARSYEHMYSVLARGFPEGTVPFGPTHVPFGQSLNVPFGKLLCGDICVSKGVVEDRRGENIGLVC